MPQRLGRTSILLALGGWLVVGAAAGAGDWLRFRGPNGTGVATDPDVPVQWKEGEGLLWKTMLPGLGHSSPIVSRGLVFLQSGSEDGGKRWLVCLDAASGKLLWQQAAPGGRARLHPKNSLASSTPAADGERVYVTFWDGSALSLCAYDYRGVPQWQRELGKFTSQHGAGHSPMVFEDRVILANDQDGSAVLLAFDARTGKTLWQAQRKAYRACYATPFLLENGGAEPELIVSSTGGLTSYRPRTGAVNWNFTWTGDRMPLRTVASPVASHGLVFASAGDGSGDRHLVAVRTGGSGDVTRTHLAWEDRKSFPYVPCLLTHGDYLYGVNDQGIAACHEARTGREVWSQRLGGAVTASPILVDGKVYAAAEDGSVYVFPAAPTFMLLAKNSLGEPVTASPAVSDNRLYLRGKEHLFCIGKAR